jgi:hypothetical protein
VPHPIWVVGAAIVLSSPFAGSATAGQVTAMFAEQDPILASSTDTKTDSWSLSFAGDPSEGIFITRAVITLDQNVVFDIAAGGPGKSNAFGFGRTSGPAATATVNDGGKTLTLDFAPASFGVGGTLAFTIDVDDGNSVVRGFQPGNSGGAGSDLAGASVLLTLNNNGFTQQGQFTFNQGTDSTAQGSFEIAAVPEPSTLVGGLMFISLAGAGAWSRRRSRSS